MPDQRRGIVVLLSIQALERSGHYGLLSVLLLYLIDDQSMRTGEAYTIVGAFTALAALTSVGGGFLADRVFGRSRCLVAGCLLMAAGAAMLAGRTAALFAPGLGLIAVGTGLLRPNIPALVGRLYDHDGQRATAFNLLYLGTNLGGMLGPIAISFASLELGYGFGFVSVAALRLAALAAYLAGRRTLAPLEEPRPHRPWAQRLAVAACCAAIALGAAVVAAPSIAGWCVAAACVVVVAIYLRLIAGQDRQGRGKLVAHLFVVVAAVAFWAIYQQFTLSVVVFTQADVDRWLWQWLIPASAFNALNPALVLLLGPMIIAAWHVLARRGKEPNDFLKLGIGILVAGLAFEALRLGAHETDAAVRTPLAWLIAFQALLAAGELLVGPVGLALSHRLSLPGMNGFFTGMWYMSTAVAYYISGVLAADVTAGGTSEAVFGAAFTDFGTIGIVAGLLTVVLSFGLSRLVR